MLKLTFAYFQDDHSILLNLQQTILSADLALRLPELTSFHKVRSSTTCIGILAAVLEKWRALFAVFATRDQPHHNLKFALIFYILHELSLFSSFTPYLIWPTDNTLEVHYELDAVAFTPGWILGRKCDRWRIRRKLRGFCQFFGQSTRRYFNSKKSKS